ncbi:pentatricopeptide repeat-containing protein At4g02750-like [Amaranthus tricolor]|uniref:pentatricopeptide repeat-containing protein At4g02750-like n=1 Tax=Amaranthus tricolor TaxID=29722 RepID=UPI00258A702C|nr:pentatricopeptide repeat-containing protein At4g02750-like [Amaranthus tricolor]
MITFFNLRTSFHLQGALFTAVDLHNFLQSTLYSTQHVSDYNAKITAFSKAGNMGGARQLFDQMRTRDVVTWNALLTGYWKNGLFHESKKLFESMPERSEVSWNSMIAGCIENDRIDEGFRYFRMMPRRNVASWNAMISGFVKFGMIEKAIDLFKKMPYMNVVSCTTMINGYLRKGMVREAKALFDQISQKNSVTWTVMISGYVENALFAEARDLFEQMPYKTVVATTAMLTGYCKEGKMEDARNLFDQIWPKDYAACNALITGYSQSGNGVDALEIFSEMLRLGIRPDKTTFVALLTACSTLSSLKEGRQTHSLIVKFGFESNLSVCNALLSMYSKCGSVMDSELAFAEIQSPDVVSWNSRFSGLAQHGLCEKVSVLFNDMCASGITPDSITFLCMLSSCGHTGRVNESMALFDAMTKDYGIHPCYQHHACLVDILCRSGQLEKAYETIQEMPFEAGCDIWGALLAACLVNLNVEFGELAAKKLLDLDPNFSGAYIMLSNIYAGLGMWKEVTKVRCLMKEKGVKKHNAYSWIEIGDQVHVFEGWAVSHPEIDEIYSQLKQIRLHMVTAEDALNRL